MVDVSIRRAVPADAASVHDLVQLAYARYVPLIGRRPAPMDADYGDVLRSSDTWVAELGGRIVGVAVTRPHAGHLLLENIAVHPAVQGQGIGDRLLALVEQHAVASDLPEVRLYTNEVMTENIAFYGRRGFRETGRTGDSGFRRVFFAKPVARRG